MGVYHHEQSPRHFEIARGLLPPPKSICAETIHDWKLARKSKSDIFKKSISNRERGSLRSNRSGYHSQNATEISSLSLHSHSLHWRPLHARRTLLIKKEMGTISTLTQFPFKFNKRSSLTGLRLMLLCALNKNNIVDGTSYKKKLTRIQNRCYFFLKLEGCSGSLEQRAHFTKDSYLEKIQHSGTTFTGCDKVSQVITRDRNANIQKLQQRGSRKRNTRLGFC
jgi:hypothetical protein